jgi:hypothetical protein
LSRPQRTAAVPRLYLLRRRTPSGPLPAAGPTHRGRLIDGVGRSDGDGTGRCWAPSAAKPNGHSMIVGTVA